MKREVSKDYSNVLLRLLILQKANSRVDLAKLAGVTKMTATNYVTDWIKQGWLVEKKAPSNQGAGRPKSILKFGPKAPRLLGVFVDDKTITLSVGTLEQKIEESWSMNLDTDLNLAVQVKSLLSSYWPKFINLTIFSMSFVVIGHEEQLEELKEIMAKDYPFPAYFYGLENAVLMHEIIKDQVDSALLISLGNDVASIEFNADTKRFQEPKIGHLSIDYNGLACSCGKKGCLQAYINKSVMEKKLRDISKMKLDFAGFCQMQQKKNDARIDWALKDMAEKLGYAIANALLINGIKPVYLSGEAVYLPDRYIAKLEKEVREQLSCQEITIQKATVTKSDYHKLPIEMGLIDILF